MSKATLEIQIKPGASVPPNAPLKRYDMPPAGTVVDWAKAEAQQQRLLAGTAATARQQRDALAADVDAARKAIGDVLGRVPAAQPGQQPAPRSDAAAGVLGDLAGRLDRLVHDAVRPGPVTALPDAGKVFRDITDRVGRAVDTGAARGELEQFADLLDRAGGAVRRLADEAVKAAEAQVRAKGLPDIIAPGRIDVPAPELVGPGRIDVPPPELRLPGPVTLPQREGVPEVPEELHRLLQGDWADLLKGPADAWKDQLRDLHGQARDFQLAFPDEATKAMDRLAEAVIALKKLPEGGSGTPPAAPAAAAAGVVGVNLDLSDAARTVAEEVERQFREQLQGVRGVGDLAGVLDRFGKGIDNLSGPAEDAAWALALLRDGAEQEQRRRQELMASLEEEVQRRQALLRGEVPAADVQEIPTLGLDPLQAAVDDLGAQVRQLAGSGAIDTLAEDVQKLDNVLRNLDPSRLQAPDVRDAVEQRVGELQAGLHRAMREQTGEAYRGLFGEVEKDRKERDAELARTIAGLQGALRGGGKGGGGIANVASLLGGAGGGGGGAGPLAGLAGAGGGGVSALAAGAGPIGLGIGMLVQKAEEIQEDIRKTVDAAVEHLGRFSVSIARLDADDVGRQFTDLARKIPVVGERLGQFGDVVSGLIAGFDQTADRLASYSPDLALARATIEARNVIRDVQRAQQMGPQLSQYMRQRQAIRERLEDLMLRAMPVILTNLERILALAEAGARHIGPIADRAQAVSETLNRNAEQYLPLYAQLRQMARSLLAIEGNTAKGADLEVDLFHQFFGGLAAPPQLPQTPAQAAPPVAPVLGPFVP